MMFKSVGLQSQPNDLRELPRRKRGGRTGLRSELVEHTRHRSGQRGADEATRVADAITRAQYARVVQVAESVGVWRVRAIRESVTSHCTLALDQHSHAPVAPRGVSSGPGSAPAQRTSRLPSHESLSRGGPSS